MHRKTIVRISWSNIHRVIRTALSESHLRSAYFQYGRTHWQIAHVKLKQRNQLPIDLFVKGMLKGVGSFVKSNVDAGLIMPSKGKWSKQKPRKDDQRHLFVFTACRNDNASPVLQKCSPGNKVSAFFHRFTDLSVKRCINGEILWAHIETIIRTGLKAYAQNANTACK